MESIDYYLFRSSGGKMLTPDDVKLYSDHLKTHKFYERGIMVEDH